VSTAPAVKFVVMLELNGLNGLNASVVVIPGTPVEDGIHGEILHVNPSARDNHILGGLVSVSNTILNLKGV
jgi:hypothetical protein